MGVLLQVDEGICGNLGEIELIVVDQIDDLLVIVVQYQFDFLFGFVCQIVIEFIY